MLWLRGQGHGARWPMCISIGYKLGALTREVSVSLRIQIFYGFWFLKNYKFKWNSSFKIPVSSLGFYCHNSCSLDDSFLSPQMCFELHDQRDYTSFSAVLLIHNAIEKFNYIWLLAFFGHFKMGYDIGETSFIFSSRWLGLYAVLFPNISP